MARSPEEAREQTTILPGETKVLEIIHLSDIHYGKKSICNETYPGEGKGNLSRLLLKDLKQPLEQIPTFDSGKWRLREVAYDRILCVTGDFAQDAEEEEFRDAFGFLNDVRKGLGGDLAESMESVFIVPGNHDLKWDAKTPRARWQLWTNFYNDLHGTTYLPENQMDFVRLVRHPRLPVLILCLHSEMHITNVSPYRQCGLIDADQVQRIDDLLAQAEKAADFHDLIKVALVHHHPVLIPSLVEPGRGVQQAKQTSDPGYDAIFGAPRLLSHLHDRGFHVLLHGHKHYPHVFTEDITNAFDRQGDHAMLIVAGGTLGSDDLPKAGQPRQCYNRIRIHWNSRRGTARVQVLTRGLVRKDERDRDLLFKKWHWKTSRIVDRDLGPSSHGPSAEGGGRNPKSAPPKDSRQAVDRGHEYQRLRNSFPAFEVLPGLVPGQGYEVKFWIEAHNTPERPYDARRGPINVVWYAGPKFPTLTIDRRSDPNFCGAYHAYGPMLLQAEMHFQDGPPELAHVYVWFPRHTPPTNSCT